MSGSGMLAKDPLGPLDAGDAGVQSLWMGLIPADVSKSLQTSILGVMRPNEHFRHFAVFFQHFPKYLLRRHTFDLQASALC